MSGTTRSSRRFPLVIAVWLCILGVGALGAAPSDPTTDPVSPDPITEVDTLIPGEGGSAEPTSDPLPPATSPGTGPPAIGFTPPELVATAEGGQQTVVPFALDNLTDGGIDYELLARPADDGVCTPRVAYLSSFLAGVISRFDLVTGEFETLLPSTFRPNNNMPLSRDGQRLYYTVSTPTGSLNALDLVSGERTRLTQFSGDDPEGPVGLALDFAEETLYFSQDRADRVQALDLATGEIRGVATGISGAQGLALSRDETRLYVAGFGRLSEIDLPTGQVRQVDQGGLGYLFDVVLSADEKTAYASDNFRDRIVAIDVATGVVSTVASNVARPDGVAIDPLDRILYFGSTSPDFTMKAVDLATGDVRTVTGGEVTGITLALPRGCEAEYLSFDPDRGSLPPFGSEPVQATFDTLDLLDGVYRAEIDLRDAATNATLATAPATFTVVGFPDIRLPTDPIDFGDLFLGLSATRELILANAGRRVLNVTLSTASSEFDVTPTELSVAPEFAETITVTFTPGTEGDFQDALVVSSNDPDAPVLSIDLSGRGLRGPEIVVTPESVEATLPEQGQTTVTLNVANLGGQPLELFVTPSPGASPGGAGRVCYPKRVRWIDQFVDALIGLDLDSGAKEVTPLAAMAPPFDVELNRAQTRAYLSDFSSSEILVLELTTGELRTLTTELSSPLGLAVDDQEETLYATEWFAGRVARVDLATGAIERLPASFLRPTSLALAPGGGTLYVADQGNRLFAVDLATGDSELVASGLFDPDLGLEVDPSGTTAWVAHGRIRGGRVSSVDLATGAVDPAVTGLVWPRGLAVEGDLAWITEVSGPVSRLELTTGALTPVDPGNFSLVGLDLECATFVTVDPASSIVPPGGSVAIALELSAGELAQGGYAAVLTLTSNDATDPELIVPVALEVVPPNRPPVAVCRDTTVIADANCLAVADVDGGSFDPDGGTIVLEPSPAPPYPLGTTLVTLTATDTAGATDSCTGTVTVVDATPPELSLVLSPDTLWPPNHRLVDVEATVVTSDNCGPTDVVLERVTSSEPDNGEGDGNTAGDVQDAAIGSADFAFRLRAERAGGGDGRLYTVVYAATDGAGNAATATATVAVPHDRQGVTDPVEIVLDNGSAGTLVRWSAVDGAVAYDVVRGELDQLRTTGDAIDLGELLCIEGGSTDPSTVGNEDLQLPPPGRAFYYLVQYDDGSRSSYGSVSAGRPRAAGSGGCE